MIITEDKEVDIFVASKIGSFKHIKFHTDTTKNNKKCVENLVEIKSLQKDDTITSMVWGSEEQTEILLSRRNSQIQVYNTYHAQFTKTYTADFGTGDIVGLGRCKRKILAAMASGVVKVWSKKEEFLVNTGGKLDCMRVCGEDQTMFATGGEENDLKIYRIGEAEPLFQAKNLPHDWLQLRRPVWVSSLTFLPESGGALLAVCSRHGYVRLYDTRAQRRPVCNVDFEKMAATSIVAGFDERQVFVGFGRGQLHQVDLRKGRLDKGYKGAAGAITDIATVTDGKYVVSTSLDRHIRIHSHLSKDLVYKQYLTSKLYRVLVQTATSTPLKNAEVKEEEEEVEPVTVDEMDQLFDKMETVGDKPRKTNLPALESEAKRSKISEENSADENPEEKIKELLKKTEKQKKKLEKKKRQKKAKSLFHNA